MAKKHIEELVEEQAENEIIEETVIDVIETPKTHTVENGDTWISISETYRGDKTNHEYAKELIAKNNNCSLIKGKNINL